MDISKLTFDEALTSLWQKLLGWVEGLILMLPNLVASLVVVVLFWLLAKVLSGLVEKVLYKISANRQISGLLRSVTYLAIVSAGVFIALGILQLDKTVTSLLTGVGIIGLALGFAFQDLAANFMAGILLSLRRPFKIHEIISTNEYMGTVEEITLRSTKIKTFQGQFVLIPNKEVFGKAIVNYSQLGKRRIDIPVGVSYGDDLGKAKEVAIEAVKSIEALDTSREVEVIYKEFGGSSINFDIRFWISFRKQIDFLSAQSEAIERIKVAFDENDISIPFPISTLDFGIRGGKELSEVLAGGAQSRGDSSGASRDEAAEVQA